MVDRLDGERADRARLRAGLTSLAVALVLLAAKYWAYRITRSTAVLSDALESIVNVVAAAFSLGGLAFAARPADRNHPYGHGKVEFLSATFEGGLIAFAALVILYEAGQTFLHGSEVRAIDTGLAVVVGAALANLALGWFLVRTGRRHESLALVADGQHVLSDSWTSAGIVLGLLLVRWTGLTWIDALAAALVALNLLVTGARLVRHAVSGLLDEEDTPLLDRLLAVFRPHIGQGVIRVHHLRAIRSGRLHHVDADLVVPEFWSVDRAHEMAEDLSRRIIRELGVEGELIFHIDPCHQAYCGMCDLESCPVRREPYRERPPLTLEEAVRPDTPSLEDALPPGGRAG